jgi:hypothetical protein
MPVTIRWSNSARTVLRFIFEEPYTWIEFEEAIEIARAHHRQLSHKVVWLFDFSQVISLPAGAIGMGRRIVRDSIPNRHPDFIILGANARVKSVWRIFERVIGQRYGVQLHNADTEDEVWQQIAQLLTDGAACR